MTELTLVQRFGTHAVIDDSSADNPKLVISLNDLMAPPEGDLINGLGDTTTITPTNVQPDKILAALLLLNMQNQPTSNNDKDIGVWVEYSRKRFVVRTGLNQTGYIYTVELYNLSLENLVLDNVV